ncbi:MAG: hypothetical protein DME04_26485 [Candidatus Rokuibacteriota bacterium]|nr:MAG: hypothetical protein DME04_26485 [Candidatus Rokubacteria bacterium]
MKTPHLVKPQPPVAVLRVRLEMEWANRAKALRTLIRLKHSIAADNEINEVLAVEQKKFWKSIQLGHSPEPLNVQKALGG